VRRRGRTLGAHGAAKLYHWDSADAHGYVTLPQVEALEQVLRDLRRRHAAVRLVQPRQGRRGAAGDPRRRRRDHRRTDLEVVDGKLVATKEVFGGD
jgi:electron transfer flavoprotein alpha subunit